MQNTLPGELGWRVVRWLTFVTRGRRFVDRLIRPTRGWRLWTLPPAAIGWLLGTELLAVGAVLVRSTLPGWPRPHAWLVFVALTVGATLHLVLTRPAEEHRAEPPSEHIDQTAVWLFTGALVLPMPLFAVLLGLVGGQRYLLVQRPPSRVLFSTAGTVLAAAAAQWIADHTPVSGWLADTPQPPAATVHTALVGAGLLAAMGGYFAVQSLLIGVARGLLGGHWSPRVLAGSRADNMLLVQSMCLGLLATLAVAFTAALLIVVVPVAVHVTRNLHRIRQLEVDQRQLTADAEHDPLTGLLNRRGFDPRARHALAAAAATGRSVAVVMFDVDHFTRWNARLGHLGADVLLQAITDCVTGAVRSSDLVGRWGGEELALVLPEADRAAAVDIVNRIRRRVADLRVTISTPTTGRTLQTNSGALPGCTISAGIAVAPEHGTDLYQLQELADQAVYQAKRLGRNRVELAGPGPRIPAQRSGAPHPQPAH